MGNFFESLVAAYASPMQPCRVASLSIVSYYTRMPKLSQGLSALLETLADATHHGTRHVSLNIRSAGCKDTLVADVASMLATNTTLETLYVRNPSNGSAQKHTWMREQLAPFQDQVLNDASAAALGLLSVVEHTPHAAQGSLDALAIQTILQFVGPTCVRCVRWLCDASPLAGVTAY